MEDPDDDVQDLSSQDADDDFERLMIQNARDERRLKDALEGTRRVQTFSKARKHPRVGLTLDNLERNARNEEAPVKSASPPSSSGSARSDPAIHAPPTWGRKSRTNRNWMRTITYEEQVQTPPPTDETVNGLYDDQYEDHADDAHMPRRSIEDSPLSHKGTPRNDRSAEWDLTFELNEASMIASTPYIPRNTMLDDIRQREVDVVKPDRRSDEPLDEIRPLRVSFRANNNSATEPAAQGSASPEKRLRNRTNSWQSIGKSQPVTGTGKEVSPVTLYKTATDTVSVVERDIITTTQQNPIRPRRHRREDSQDLLRRLARASNTPSPGRVSALRPQTAPARQVTDSSQPMATDTTPPKVHANEDPVEETVPKPMVENSKPETQKEAQDFKQTPPEKPQETQPEEPKQNQPEPEAQPEPLAEAEVEDVDATPMPSNRPKLDPKTPVVTGAWVDTPGPRTVRKHISIARSRSQSPKKSSPRKSRSPGKSAAPTVDEAPESTAVEVTRPQLPSSALHALVQEAKAHGKEHSADYGDSTINSLEDLISSPPEGEIDEDTLMGLQLPTITPRNDAERQRQLELLHLHRMNDRLRAARTSIRDASRGMKHIEDRVEHGDDATKPGLRECPCAAAGVHHASLWRRTKRLFWDANLKTERSGTRWRMLGGLTLLSLFALVLFTWWISEEVACEMYCHHPYAKFSPYAFSVNPNAPKFPFVIPTLVYRGVTGWVPPGFAYAASGGFGSESAGATQSVAWATQSQVVEEVVWDQSMMHDEVVR
jgi:hypothetical protein